MAIPPGGGDCTSNSNREGRKESQGLEALLAGFGGLRGFDF
jgi:hypothetical protein